jgi:heptose-I-phosphate ethanolaminephosphotransferase
MRIFTYLLSVVVLTLFTTGIYLATNHGIRKKAYRQRFVRYLVAYLLSLLPMAITGTQITSGALGISIAIAALWAWTYSLLYHLTNRKSSPDYDHYREVAMGIYLFGGLSSLNILIGIIAPGNVIAACFVSLLDIAIAFLPIAQIIYYLLYNGCIDNNGIKIIQDTNQNEIIEFFKSFQWWKTLFIALLILVLMGGILVANTVSPVRLSFNWIHIAIITPFLFYFMIYVWKPKTGLFPRTELYMLWEDVKIYNNSNKKYITGQKERLKNLIVNPLGGSFAKPSTIMMVIGESGSRDYTSAFTKMEHDTSPWLRKCKEDDKHFILFPHAYSCAMHTVQALEKALTEKNQYNDLEFYSSCSVVDIAHKLGYRVHWYSNQGHLGVNDTPITLVADTSEVSKWTKQELNKVQYDQALLDFLDEINPNVNNFVVLHLKGSHFNFQNRYPKEFSVWKETGAQGDIRSYENSIHYTDYILQQFFEYGKNKLNLQAMYYFSDHATVPDARRSPNFSGFGPTRIPMFTYFSDEYISLHPNRVAALQANKDKYFTNDLAYDLMCGIFDIQSNHFDESNSLASPDYRYTRDMLKTYEGKFWIKDDKSEDTE